MGYTALPTKNPGDILTSALWNTYLQGNADSGFMRMLADTTLGGAAAQIDFASIPATFAHLMLILYPRGDAAAVSTGLIARFNGDAGANYDWQLMQGQAAVASAAEGIAATGIFSTAVPAASAVGNAFGIYEMLIPHYTNTASFKGFTGRASSKTTNASGGITVQGWSGFWRNVAALNRITLSLASGNFAAGSRATLYGLPA
jgi:hypothetical protein